MQLGLDTRQITHIAAQLATNIAAPNPEIPTESRTMELATIAGKYRTIGTMIEAVAVCAPLLKQIVGTEPDVDNLARRLKTRLPDDASTAGYDLGIGFARLAFSPNPTVTAPQFLTETLPLITEDPQKQQELVGGALVATLAIYQQFASPW